MSVKLELYQDIKAKLQELSNIKNVIHYNGQDGQNYEKTNARQFPQSWIQLTDITWNPSELVAHNSNRTQQQKSGSITITIYYASWILKEDNDTFETDLVAIDEIYRALTMLSGDNYGPLQRQSENDIPTTGGVRVWAQTFTTMLTECGISTNLTDAAPVELTIIKKVL
jgi:hypothetical protein